MKKGHYIDEILRSPKTVFSTKDIAILWGEAGDNRFRARLNYAVKHGKLIRIRRGIYAKNENYNPYELGVKLNTPAYISFETVLAQAGVIFQYYDTIFVASYVSRSINCGPYQFMLRSIKADVLTNPLGINNDNGYSVASTERAILDTLYLNKNYYFDNLAMIDWDKVFYLLGMYDNKKLCDRVNKLYKETKQEN